MLNFVCSFHCQINSALLQTITETSSLEVRRNTMQSSKQGLVAAQAGSRRLPTEAARVPALVSSCGICGGQSGTRAGFLQVILFPLQIIPPIAPYSSHPLSSGAIQ
jgi:hypothetical protein